jgi:hypothetical protein
MKGIHGTCRMTNAAMMTVTLGARGGSGGSGGCGGGAGGAGGAGGFVPRDISTAAQFPSTQGSPGTFRDTSKERRNGREMSYADQ